MRGLVLLVLAWVLLGGRSRGDSLDDLLRRVPAVAVATDGGIGMEAQQLAIGIQAFGAQAIPRVLPLLESPQEPVREFAGYVLSGLDGLTEEHLDSLLRAWERGNGWIPGAIGRIGTPRAIGALVADLKARPEDETQVTGALERAGEKAAVALARSFRDPDPLSDDYASCVRQILSAMREQASAALDPLLEIALAPDVSTTHRRFAIQAIGGTGLAGRRVIPALRALAGAAPSDFAACVDRTIVGIGGPEAAPILAQWLETIPDPRGKGRTDVHLIWDIAALGRHGLGAGSTVSKYLSADDPDVRIAAARALGEIGYREAAEALAREVGRADDWQLAYVSAESLGRLRAIGCLPALEEAAATHWFPPVQAAAKQAIAVIRGPDQSGSSVPSHGSARDFFDYEWVGGEESEKNELPPLSMGPDVLTAEQLARSRYTVEMSTFDGTGESIRPIEQQPDCGLQVPGGLLLGSSRGEWGGELVQVRPDTPTRVLLDENVLAVHRTPMGIVAVTGLAHLSSQRGVLYRIEPRPRGIYEAVWWKRLPGEPQASGLLDDGSLFVRCLGGDVVVTPRGEIRLARTR